MNKRHLQPVLAARAIVFYLVYSLATVVVGLASRLVYTWLPYRVRAPLILLWNRFALAWAWLACGIKYRVIGRENIPDHPVVVFSKHESQWETIFLQLAFHPIATVLKRELLNTPVFGWGLRLMKPIAIDRGSPREALKRMFLLSEERLQEGISVLIFPEGTRTEAGELGRFARGGASIAIKAGVPILPVAHNAGSYWRPHQLVKYPGTITVAIGPAIDTRNKTAAKVTEEARSWIAAQLENL